MNVPDTMTKLFGGFRVAALGLILTIAVQPVLPGIQGPVARAQSANPTVLNLLAAVRSGQPNIQSLISNALGSVSDSALSQFVSSLFTSSGGLGGNVAALVVQAVGTMGPAAQASVGAGIGNAAVQLAANGNGSSANAILSNLSGAPSGLTTGLTTGVAQAVASIGGNSANAINAAAQGTSVAGAVSSGVQTAQGNPNPGNPSPTCTSNCGSGN